MSADNGRILTLQPRMRFSLGEVRAMAGFQVTPVRDEIHRILRIKKQTQLSVENMELMTRMESLAGELVRPAAVYGIFPGLRPGMKAEPGAELHALAVVTIGSALEDQVEKLNRNRESGTALILDAMGSAWVEGVAEAVENTLHIEAAVLGCKSRPRRSPGYHPWPLSAQKDIFQALHPEQIHVTLLDSFMMHPRKSVSFGMLLVADRG